MKTIRKYPFAGNEGFSIDMPIGAEILCVQLQNERPCLFALVDSYFEDDLEDVDANELVDLESRYFDIYATGAPIQDYRGKYRGKYIGTYQLAHGTVEFHIFEVE